MMVLPTLTKQETTAVETIVREAGKIILEHWRDDHTFREKSTEFDPVTAIDLAVEAFLRDRLTGLIPGSLFLAEETASDEDSLVKTWVVDPIDGTVNFIHRFPFVCVSVGWVVDGVIRNGFIHNPITGDFYRASEGLGSTKNDLPIRVSSVNSLKKSLLGTGFPYDFSTNPENNLRFFEAFHNTCQGIRRPGSAALDLCCVAEGSFDGFWEWRLNPWDVAAGIRIIIEAGGVVTNYSGEPYRFGDTGIVTGNPAVHRHMLEIISGLNSR